MGGGADGSESGCTKVDFLFVIDNSESMEDDQVRLINAFPEFIDGIQNTIAAEDYHIGVITTDDHTFDWDIRNAGFPRTECDVMGGLVHENWDYIGGTHKVCGPFASGGNYLTQADANLTEKFECIAFVDDEGSTNEAPMDAIKEALATPTIPCNTGFLREDALLVLVLITDEDDDTEPGNGNPGSAGDPQDWFDVVMAAKGNDPSRATVLALAGTPDCSYEHTVRIEQWVGMFGANGFMGPVCVDDYGNFFKDSVTVVDQACNDFVPPG